MKITCESCSAQYDLDDNRIPPSGMTMKCPACLHSFTVRRGAAPPPPKPAADEVGNALSELIEEEAPELPAPVSAAAKTRAQKATELPDLPAPKAPAPARAPLPSAAATLQTGPPPSMPLITPAPPASVPLAEIPVIEEEEPELPALKPHTRTAPSDDVIDLPAPVAARPGVVDLPAPVAGPKKGFSPALVDDEPDLPAPRSPLRSVRPSVGIDLDAPEADDLLEPVRNLGYPMASPPPHTPEELDGPPPIDLEALDVVAPKEMVNQDLAPKGAWSEAQSVKPKAAGAEAQSVTPKSAVADAQSMTPKGAYADSTSVTPKGAYADSTAVAPKGPYADSTSLAPKPEETNLTPANLDVQPVERPPAWKGEDVPPSVEVAAPQRVESPSAYVAGDDEETRRRVWTGLLFGGGALLFVAAVGISLGLFTTTGYFAVNLITGKSAEMEARLAAARKLHADDTLASYKRAATELRSIVEEQPRLREAAALEAVARLGSARLGVAAEGKNADRILAEMATDEKATRLPEYKRAQALQALLAGKLVDARAQLAAVLAQAPADAAAQVNLGWTELASGDPGAADKAFQKALAVEPNRAAALFGAGQAKERLGDLDGAKDAYTRALGRSQQHFGAQVGLARVAAKKPPDAKAMPPADVIQKLIDARASSVGPREVADAWASLGQMALEAGRREEAEDRLKRAVALDADSVFARVLLARVQCDLGRSGEAVVPLRKIVASQQKNLTARLTLVRALLESKIEGGHPEAQTLIASAAAEAPKDPRILYWQARVLLGAEKADRDGALAKLKAAVEADPKLLDAYLTQSQVLAQLGKTDEAMEVLKQAAARASDDARLLTELGEAYLALGKPVEAEPPLRAAVEKNPDAHQARIDLGLALEQQSKLAEAQAAYDKVAEAAPNFPGLAEQRGRLAVKQNKKDEAWKLFEGALAQGTPTQGLRLAAAELALDLGKLDVARSLGEAVSKDDDRSPQAHLIMARANLEGGHPEEALPVARRAATLADLPEAHLVLGKILETMGKLDQAVSEYQLARRGSSENEATLGRARIMVRMGASKDALAELTALVNDNRLRAPAFVLMGDCYSDLQQPDKARKSYEAAVKFGPNLAEAAFKFGRALHDGGKRRPAIDQLTRSLKLGGDKAPWAPEATLLLGDCHREGHENDAAVRAYKKYLEIAPPEAPARAEVMKHLSILGGG